MNLNPWSESPFKLQISFHKIIEHLEDVAANQTGARAAYARATLEEIAPYPELRNGITDKSQIINNKDVIHNLLLGIFPEALTDNEIKAVNIPFQDILFNQTKRFQKILDAAGTDFKVDIRDFDEHQFYIMSCCIILDQFYDRHFNFGKPLYYDIPDARGVMRHYRILYNGEFLELTPTERAVKLSKEDIDQLRDNYHDLDLWKEKFPVGSWNMRGFGIISLYDATLESAVSSLKGTLLGREEAVDVHDDIQSVFRSIYRIPDLRVGFVSFDPDDEKFTIPTFAPKLISYLMPEDLEEEFCNDTLCTDSLSNVAKHGIYFAVSDISIFLAQNPRSASGKRLLDQNIHSFILAPAIKDGKLLGVIELVSSRVGELNSINANQLDIVMPFITDTIDRKFKDTQNQVQALIQSEYTTIHPSVYWKFKKEANKFLQLKAQHQRYTLREVAFADVYPLYGQIDIKGSSDTRNQSLQTDLENQLTALVKLVNKYKAVFDADHAADIVQTLRSLDADLRLSLRADTEQQIQHYLEDHVHPALNKVLLTETEANAAIKRYFEEAGRMGKFHLQRRKYETTVALINERMSQMLDKWQSAAQAVYPHYYERFKTDGVEHNLYIGPKISPTREFDMKYVYNLRLWQLQVLCQMELEHHYNKDTLPYPLEVTSLLLAFSVPISIRFRMDEKRFDVDGTYNARFEIVKKRIDKAFVKNTTDRITAIGKLTIVYTNADEELEYLTYIRFLQQKEMLDKEIEMLEIEDLQGISGLKALRVKILYNSSIPFEQCYTYEELQKNVDAAYVSDDQLKLQGAE